MTTGPMTPTRVLEPAHRRRGIAPGRTHPDVRPRACAIAAVAAIAAVHLLDAPDTYASTRYIFWLYMALVAASMATIMLLVRWRSPRVWAATTVLATGPFVGYIASRSIGLPGDANDVGDWLNSLGVTSLLIEGFLITFSVGRLWRLTRVPAHPPQGVRARAAE